MSTANRGKITFRLLRGFDKEYSRMSKNQTTNLKINYFFSFILSEPLKSTLID